VFGLKLWDKVWLDDDNMALVLFNQYMPTYCPDIGYSSVKCQSVLSNEECCTNWHVDGVTYKSQVELSIDDIDNMRVQVVNMLNTALSTYYLTYDRIDVVSDQFYEDPTPGY